jgi:hypothetical protein
MITRQGLFILALTLLLLGPAYGGTEFSFGDPRDTASPSPSPPQQPVQPKAATPAAPPSRPADKPAQVQAQTIMLQCAGYLSCNISYGDRASKCADSNGPKSEVYVLSFSKRTLTLNGGTGVEIPLNISDEEVTGSLDEPPAGHVAQDSAQPKNG